MVKTMKKVVIFLILLLTLTGCNNQEYYSKNLFYMDTVINIKIYDNNEEIDYLVKVLNNENIKDEII